MNTIALWSNIIALAVMASSIGLTFVIRSRRNHRWLDFYLIYAGSYALWTLLFSAAFFIQIYEPLSRAWFTGVAAWVRVLISGAVLFALPLMLATISRSAGTTRLLRVAGVVLGGAYLVLGAASAFIPSMRYGIAINVTYNLFGAALSVTGLVVLRRTTASKATAARRILPPFLVVSAIFYIVAVVIGAVFLTRPMATPLVSSFAIAGYCLPWGIVMLRQQSRYLAGGGAEPEVPEAFVADFSLTPREREVVAAAVRGLSNAEIAAAQYVSLKTVETHLYNVYRKTGIKSRVALVNRVAAYRGDGGASQ